MVASNEPASDSQESRTTILVERPSSGVVLITLLGVLVALLLLDAASRVAGGGLIARFSLGGQSSVANWWASVQLLSLSGLLWIVAIGEAANNHRRAAWALRLGAAVAIVLSLEEIAGLQQSIPIGFVRSGLVSTIDSARDMVFVGLLVVALIALALALPGILDLLKRHRVDTVFVLLGGLLVFGGGAAIDAVDVLAPSHTKAVVEDLFQFLGIAVMVWATYRILESDEVRVLPR